MDDKVLSFLRDYQIYSIKDLEAKKDMLSEKRVMEEFWPIAWEEYELASQYIEYEDYGSTSRNYKSKDKNLYFCFNNDVVLNKYSDISKYCCIFPQKTIIESGQLCQAGFIEGDPYVDIYKIAKSHFLYNKIISNGLALITPQFFYASEDSAEKGLNVSYLDRLYIPGYNDKPFLDYMYVALPWLHNARVEDYIDIIDKYRLEFENYNIELRKIADAAKDKEILSKKVFENIQEIYINIEIALEKKRHTLVSKGITAFVGVCFTLVPFVFPEILTSIDTTFFPTVFGGGTILQAVNLYNDFVESRSIKRESPYWVMWKWQHISK